MPRPIQSQPSFSSLHPSPLARLLVGTSVLLSLAACSSDGADETRDAPSDAAAVEDAAATFDAGSDATTPEAGTRRDAPKDASAMRAEDAAGPREPALDAGAPNEPMQIADAGQQGPTEPTAPDAASGGDAAVIAPTDAMVPSDAGPPDPTTQRLAPRLVASSYDGELCPEGSAHLAEADDHSAITITFSTALEGDEPAASLTGRCTLALTFDVPEGYAFGDLHVYGSGYAYGPEGSAALTLGAGFSEQSMQSKTFDDLDEGYAAHARFDQVWSPSCGGMSRVQLTLSVDARVSGVQYLGLSALDVGFDYTDGAQWKRCRDGQILEPPPSGKDEACGGPARHPCAPGLTCDLFDDRQPDDALLEGVCVDAAERLPPAAKGRGCGGVADIPCAEGLRCHYTNAERAARDVLGWCMPEVGGEDDHCSGYPQTACDEGLFCSARGQDRCVRSDGSLGAPCELEVMECGAGLFCNGSVCERERADAGEPCGGDEEIRCKPLYVCDPESARCVLEEGAGELGGRCGSDVSCGDGLRCVELVCVESSG